MSGLVSLREPHATGVCRALGVSTLFSTPKRGFASGTPITWKPPLATAAPEASAYAAPAAPAATTTPIRTTVDFFIEGLSSTDASDEPTLVMPRDEMPRPG